MGRKLNVVRKAALTCNLVYLMFIAYMLGMHGLPRGDEDSILVAFAAAMALLNSAALFLPGSSESLVGLYLQRLRLEQAKKIAELRRDSNA